MARGKNPKFRTFMSGFAQGLTAGFSKPAERNSENEVLKYSQIAATLATATARGAIRLRNTAAAFDLVATHGSALAGDLSSLRRDIATVADEVSEDSGAQMADFGPRLVVDDTQGKTHHLIAEIDGETLYFGPFTHAQAITFLDTSPIENIDLIGALPKGKTALGEKDLERIEGEIKARTSK